jgi:uncharacterized protein
MSGLLALLDDVAALAKLAAVQVDDIAAQAAKVSSKAVGVVVDDAAVTPKYVQGLPAARELPIIWKIARGSLFNKLVILLPAALALSAFAPWLLTPLLMLGGCYLCFEGAEKVWHLLHPESDHHQQPEKLEAAHLEERRVKKAVKTDFILSAEIMTISLSAIEADDLLSRGVILIVVAIGITVLVYGSVGLLVRMDDVGLKLTQIGRLAITRKLGRALVKAMPALMAALATIGTAAMLWVGGSIIIHGAEGLGFGWPAHTVHDLAHAAAHAVHMLEGLIGWLVNAAISGVFGLLLGLLLIPLATGLGALVERLRGSSEEANH